MMDPARHDPVRTAGDRDREQASAAAGATGGATGSAKRKRSTSPSQAARPTSTAKTHHDQASIDYLTRLHVDDLLLVTGDENLPTIMTLIDDYEGVLQRHESMAANLGAKPLGQTLMKRFDRLFDGPVKILYSQKEGAINVSWLDVVDHFRMKPQDFNLLETRHGTRMCHVWIKSCKVEVLEDDFSLIKSGMPQKLIPPQPIREDEEKELGTLDILEKRLQRVIGLTDAVSGRARMLNHRLKARKSAIMSGRGSSVHHSAAHSSNGNPPTSTSASGSKPPTSSTTLNGLPPPRKDLPARSSPSPTTGFVAVNTSRPTADAGSASLPERVLDHNPKPPPSQAVHADLLRRFSSTQHQHQTVSSHQSPHSAPKPSSKPSTPAARPAGSQHHTPGSAAYHTGSSKKGFSTPSAADDGPYKALMLAKMEHLDKGDRVTPPCDRCRRLGMDCRRNLTACMGCTRKHAKCTWLDVREGEMDEEGDEKGGRKEKRERERERERERDEVERFGARLGEERG